MKDCSYYQELISRLIDRELSAEEGEELAAHARECADCRAVYAAFSSLSGMLAERLVEPPEELAENVMAHLRRRQLRKKNTPILTRRAAAIAASAVLVLLGGSLVIPRLLRGASGEAAAPMAAPALYSASGADSAKSAAEEPAALYDAYESEESVELESTPVPVSNSFAAPAQDTTKSEEEMIAEATARAMEPETRAEVVDVSGQGRGARLSRLLTGTQGDLPAGRTPDRRFMLRYDVDGVSTQVLLSVYGEKVFFISLSGEQTDMVLADCSWSTLRGAIYN